MNQTTQEDILKSLLATGFSCGDLKYSIENENFDIHFDICDTFFDWVFYTAKKSDELLLIWRYDGYYSDDEINRETSWHSELLNIEAMKDCINEFKHILSLNH